MPNITAKAWGGWRLNRDNYTLQLFDSDDHWIYEVDLETCTDSAQVLDWIMQTQCRDERYDGLIDALRDVLHPQRNLCSGGQNKILTRAEIREIVENWR
jgi:hypothetical protein